MQSSPQSYGRSCHFDACGWGPEAARGWVACSVLLLLGGQPEIAWLIDLIPFPDAPSCPWVRSQVSWDCNFLFSLPKANRTKEPVSHPPLFSLFRREVWAPCRDGVHPKRRRARVWQWHRGRRGSKDLPKAKNHPDPASRPATLRVQLSAPLRLRDTSSLYHAFFSPSFVEEKKNCL